MFYFINYELGICSICIICSFTAFQAFLQPRLAFFLQKRPVRCLLYNKFFNFDSPCKIFRLYIKHIIAQNLMFFVFEIVTFLEGTLCNKIGAKKLYDRYG